LRRAARLDQEASAKLDRKRGVAHQIDRPLDPQVDMTWCSRTRGDRDDAAVPGAELDEADVVARIRFGLIDGSPTARRATMLKKAVWMVWGQCLMGDPILRWSTSWEALGPACGTDCVPFQSDGCIAFEIDSLTDTILPADRPTPIRRHFHTPLIAITRSTILLSDRAHSARSRHANLALPGLDTPSDRGWLGRMRRSDRSQ
jgi:hypothetical protein